MFSIHIYIYFSLFLTSFQTNFAHWTKLSKFPEFLVIPLNLFSRWSLFFPKFKNTNRSAKLVPNVVDRREASRRCFERNAAGDPRFLASWRAINENASDHFCWTRCHGIVTGRRRFWHDPHRRDRYGEEARLALRLSR